MMTAEQNSSRGGSLCCFAESRRVGGSSNKRLKIAGAAAVAMKKDKVGEKVAALQHLVSPFGKTDTASVLLEATQYIMFLHEQLQVLSSPYLCSPMTDLCSSATKCGGRGGGGGGGEGVLRKHGLCLFPVSSMLKFDGINGADLWASMNTAKST